MPPRSLFRSALRERLSPSPCGACLSCLTGERCSRRRRPLWRGLLLLPVLLIAALAIAGPSATPHSAAVEFVPPPRGAVPARSDYPIVQLPLSALAWPTRDTFDRDPDPLPDVELPAEWTIGPEDDMRCDPPGLSRGNALLTGNAVHDARILARFDAVIAAGKVKGIIDGRRMVSPVPRYAAAFRAAGIRHRVDPIALVAVAWMESRVGHTRADGQVKVNSVYAYGLMQVIGGTSGRRFGYDVRTLEGNLNAGARYLRSLLAGPIGRYGIAFSFAGYFAGGAGAMRSGGVYDRLPPKTFEYGLNVRGVYDWIVAIGEGTYDPNDLPQTGGYGAGRSAVYLTIRDGRDSARWRPVTRPIGGSLHEMVVGMANGAVDGSTKGCAARE